MYASVAAMGVCTFLLAPRLVDTIVGPSGFAWAAFLVIGGVVGGAGFWTRFNTLERSGLAMVITSMLVFSVASFASGPLTAGRALIGLAFMALTFGMVARIDDLRFRHKLTHHGGNAEGDPL